MFILVSSQPRRSLGVADTYMVPASMVRQRDLLSIIRKASLSVPRKMTGADPGADPPSSEDAHSGVMSGSSLGK